MAGESILVVEDDEDIQELLRYNLVKEGYKVSLVFTGEEGFQRALSDLPDLILLDLMLPAMDGLDVCRRLKQDPATRHIAIIMVTAKDAESDMVAGLELGADDYITKPFNLKLLVARLRAVLRRNREPLDETAVVRVRELEIHPGRHEVKVCGEVVPLTATEFRVLHLMARRPNWVFPRSKIVDSVRGDDYPVTERSVDVQIVALRKKLGVAGEYIETVRGVGYRFKE